MYISYTKKTAGKPKSNKINFTSILEETKVVNSQELFNILNQDFSFCQGIVSHDKWHSIGVDKTTKLPYTKFCEDRKILPNIVGASVAVFDIDNEYFKGVYSAEYVYNNIVTISQIPGFRLAYTTDSFGKVQIWDPEKRTEEQHKHLYPNGIKQGLRLVFSFPKTITPAILKNYISQQDIDTLWPLVTKVTYTHESEVGADSIALSAQRLQDTYLLQAFVNGMQVFFAHQVGIIDKEFMRQYNETECGFDPASFNISQIMFPGKLGNAPLAISDSELDLNIFRKEIESIASRLKGLAEQKRNKSLSVLRKVKSPVKGVKNAPVTTAYNGESCTEVEKAELRALLKFIPPREPGTGTYDNYLKITTALKFCGLSWEDVAPLWANASIDFNNLRSPLDGAEANRGWALSELTAFGNFIPSLKHTVKFDKDISVNVKYLTHALPQVVNILDKVDVLTIHSEKNTGKTFLIKEVAKKFPKVLFISHLRKVLRSASIKLGFDYYENLDSDKLKQSTHLCITWHSLHLLKDMDLSETLVVLDEHTQCLKSFASEYACIKDMQKITSAKVLDKALMQSHKVILLDADDYYGFAEWSSKRLQGRLTNEYKDGLITVESMNWGRGDEENLLMEERLKESNSTSKFDIAIDDIIEHIESGKGAAAVPCTSKKFAQKLDRALTQKGFKTLLLTGEDRTDDNGVDVLDILNSGVAEYDCCIYSPAGFTGMDISANCHKVTKVFGVFAKVRGLNDKDLAQSLYRFRGVKNANVYGIWGDTVTLLTEEDSAKRRVKKENRILNIYKEGFSGARKLALPQRITTVVDRISWFQKVTENFVSQEEFLAAVSPDSKKYFLTNATRCYIENKENTILASETIKQEEQQAFSDAKIVTGFELEVLSKSDKSREENSIYNKSILAKAVGEECANEVSKVLPPTKALKAVKLLNNYLAKDPDTLLLIKNKDLNKTVNKVYAEDSYLTLEAEYELLPSCFSFDKTKAYNYISIIHNMVNSLPKDFAYHERNDIQELLNKFTPVSKAMFGGEFKINTKTNKTSVKRLEEFEEVSQELSIDIDGNEKLYTVTNPLNTIRKVLRVVGLDFIKSRKKVLGGGGAKYSAYSIGIFAPVQTLIDNGAVEYIIAKLQPKVIELDDRVPEFLKSWCKIA
jgi:hypothetical protein